MEIACSCVCPQRTPGPQRPLVDKRKNNTQTKPQGRSRPWQYQVSSDFQFPKRKDGRSCHHHQFYRHLVNGEKVKRIWLVYSKKNNSLYCFCWKLFSQKTFKLTSDGVTDWRNCSDILKSHEKSGEHSKHMSSWKELETHLDKGWTIDKKEMALLEAEMRRWRKVLTRLVAIIQSLAEQNIALRGTHFTNQIMVTSWER